MKPLFSPVMVWAAFLAVVSSLSVSAQTPPAAPAVDIDVASVKFDNVRTNSGAWYEILVELATKPGAGADNKRFLNRVKVTLNLGTFSAKAGSGTKAPDTYYRASAEAAAIEATGGRVTYRFYLPPEIVKRDTLTGDQKFYLVELSVDGKAVPFNKATHINANVIPNAGVLESFRSELSAKAPANDGVLLPQYLTPFAFDGNRPSPTMVRVENNR